MQKIVLTCCLLLIALSGWAEPVKVQSNQFHFFIEDTPAWVLPTPVPTPKKSVSFNGRSVQYLLSDVQVRIGNDSDENFRHIALSPVMQAGLEKASEIEIEYNPQFQTLDIHRIELVRGSQRMNNLQKDKIKLIQREQDIDKKLYYGVVSALVILEDVRVGDILEYSYTIKGRNPVFGNKYFSNHSMGWSSSVERATVRILSPNKKKLYIKAHNFDLKPQIIANAKYTEYIWDQKQIQGFIDEGEYPAWYDPYPWVQVSEYRDWKDVNHWASSLYKYNGELSNTLKKKINKWKKASSNNKTRIGHALKFVQEDVRYFGVELGQNSHRPSHPNKVAEKRYGDCKDKALLLTAILKEFNINSYPALVSSSYRRGVENWHPAPNAFDHVIVMAETDGSRYWLDGTRTQQQGSLDTLGFSNFGKALVVGHEQTSLMSIKPLRTQISTVTIHEKYKINTYDKPTKLTVTSSFTGNHAENRRRYFSSNTHDKISHQYMNFYARSHPGITKAANISMRDDKSNNTFTTVEYYELQDFLNNENGKFNFDVADTTIKNYTSLPNTIQRTMPLSLPFPVKINHIITINYPADLGFVADDEKDLIEDAAITFKQNITYKKGEIIIRDKYESKMDAVYPDNINKHIGNLRKINNMLHYSGWFSSDRYNNKQARLKTHDKIKELMRRLSN